MQDPSRTYQEMSDEQLLRLANELGLLTDAARVSLIAELRKRGLNEESAKRYALETQREAETTRADKVAIRSRGWSSLRQHLARLGIIVLGGVVGCFIFYFIVGHRLNAVAGEILGRGLVNFTLACWFLTIAIGGRWLTMRRTLVMAAVLWVAFFAATTFIVGDGRAKQYVKDREISSLMDKFDAQKIKNAAFRKRLTEIRSVQPSTYEEYYQQCLALEAFLE